MVIKSPGRNPWRVAASWPPVINNEASGRSNASVGAQASAMTSAAMWVVVGAGPVWAAATPAVPTSANVKRIEMERRLRLITLHHSRTY
jgi:hypothetical protein